MHQSALVYLQLKASVVTVVCTQQVVVCVECLQLLWKQLIVVLLVQQVQQGLLTLLLALQAEAQVYLVIHLLWWVCLVDSIQVVFTDAITCVSVLSST